MGTIRQDDAVPVLPGTDTVSYSLVMRNRPIWQIIGAILVFAPLQQYFQTPLAFFTIDRLLGIQYWLTWIIVLLGLVYGLQKLGGPGRALALALLTDEPPTSSTKRPWMPLFAGLAFLLCILTMLEYRQPFFFSQDDNLAQFLPVMVQGCRSLFQGVFPTWNPYQLLGAPTTTVGIYSLTYPFTYASYFLSRYILGNEFLTIETYCTSHIIGGYFALYWAARCHRVRPVVASIAALCAVLSGWSLIAGRSWFYVSPVFVYVPLMIVGVSKLTSGSASWKWVSAMAVVIAFFFHAGNVQFWVYGMMFLWIALIVIWWCHLIDMPEVLTALAASLLGIALACPLLVPQLLQTRDAVRLMDPNLGQVDKEWRAFLVPGPWVHAYAPANSIDPDWPSGGLIVYSGTTFVLLATLLVPCFIFFRPPRMAIGNNVWFLCGTIALLGLMGRSGVIWPVMLHLPLLSKFRLPIKFLAFFNIFIVLTGAMILERVLRRVRRSTQIEWCTVAVTACLLTAACVMPMPSWYPYGIKPYPGSKSVLDQIPDAKASENRIMSITFERSPSARHWEELPYNSASIYRVPSLHGYDPLVSLSPRFLKVTDTLENQPLLTLQEYGVEYLLTPVDFNRPKLSGYRTSHRIESSSETPGSVIATLMEHSAPIFADDETSIRHIPDPRPLAFPEIRPAVSLPLRLRGDGFDIDTSSLAEKGRVIANFLWYPEIRGEVDGKSLSVAPDSWQRITVDLPRAAKEVHVRFVPPWWKGFASGGVAAFAGLLIGCFAMRRQSQAKELASATVV